MYTVYILYSEKTKRHYIGFTTDLNDRLRRHNSGATISTRKGQPWIVVYKEQLPDKKSAWLRERQIKSYKGGEAFKKLINNFRWGARAAESAALEMPYARKGIEGSPRDELGAPRVNPVANPKVMYYVYILKSLRDGDFYTGYSEDLKNRIKEHNKGKVISTKSRRPLKLICYEAYLDKETAQRRERFLKTSDGKLDINRRLKKYRNI